MTSKIRLTRPKLSAFLNENGFPIGKSTIDKLCSPAIDEGPSIDGFLGNRALYDPEVVLAWAESRLSPQRRTPRRCTPYRNAARFAGSGSESLVPASMPGLKP
jgi:hypothetical protein